MNIGYLRYFLQIYFICFIQKNDHSKLKKTVSNNRIISLSWLFEIFVSKISYNSPFTLKERKWHIFNVILTSLVISSTCKSLAATIKMKIWTEIESLKEVAQLGLESSISLMGKSVMNSAKLLNLCHELSSKQHYFFLSFSWVFNFGNPLSSSCEHRKSPEVIKRFKGHFNGKSHCKLKWTSTSCDVGSFVRGLDLVRLCLRVDVVNSAFKAILTDPSQPLTLAKNSRGWRYMSQTFLLKKQGMSNSLRGTSTFWQWASADKGL